MHIIISLGILLAMTACTPPVPHSWQDSHTPARPDATTDLDECRAFAARQYRPGIPAGEPYLKDQPKQNGIEAEVKYGPWRPDRNPFRRTHVDSRPIHDVPTTYTGYPGELDYYPDYLDDILEKCMLDRGWQYLPNTNSKN